jgi:hypothetical protein
MGCITSRPWSPSPYKRPLPRADDPDAFIWVRPGETTVNGCGGIDKDDAYAAMSRESAVRVWEDSISAVE